jgi:hypothetical protein
VKAYFYVDYINLKIRPVMVDPEISWHSDFLIIYREKKKDYLASAWKDKKTFFESREEAVHALKNFCESKIKKYEKKLMKWTSNLNNVV